MGFDDLGESSGQNGGERPQKKARFVWQVKGKYHLKAGHDNSNSGGVPMDREMDTDEGSSSKSAEEDPQCKSNCIDKFLARSEVILDSDDEESSAMRESLARSMDSDSQEDEDAEGEGSISQQDYYLRRWQARQIAKAYIDNTINNVLENWGTDHGAEELDMDDFVENCSDGSDDDGQVEDQGILMAIQAHGLHSSKSRTRRSPKFDPDKLAFLKEELAENSLGHFDLDENYSASGIPLVSANLELLHPVDILNAAVLVAIEKKGLSSYMCE